MQWINPPLRVRGERSASDRYLLRADARLNGLVVRHRLLLHLLLHLLPRLLPHPLLFMLQHQLLRLQQMGCQSRFNLKPFE